MELELWPALFAGVAGGIMMEMATVVPRAADAGVKLDLHRMWGTMLGLRNPVAGLVGTVVHLVVSALIGLAYAWALDAVVDARGGLWVWGLVGGVVHWAIAGLFMGAVLPLLHRGIGRTHPPTGFFASQLGIEDVAAFFFGHLLYGVTFGVMYAYLWAGAGAERAF